MSGGRTGTEKDLKFVRNRTVSVQNDVPWWEKGPWWTCWRPVGSKVGTQWGSGGLWEHLGGQKVDFGGRLGEERGSEIDENVTKRVKSENREVERSKVGVDY